MWDIVAALVTGVVGLIAYWLKSLRELRLKYDGELRQARLERYRVLWADLEPLAKYARPGGEALSRDEATRLAAMLKHWYFVSGGLYLSEDTRTAYFALQDALMGVTEDWGVGQDGRLDKETFEVVRVRGSRLRSNLSRDVGTRRPFILRWDGAPLDAQRVTGDYVSAKGDKSLRVWFSPLRHVWRTGGAQKPRLAIDGARAPVRDWDPWQRALTTVIEGADRVLVLEDDRIVEGPRDWEFDADHVPRHAAIWRRAQTASPTAELPSNS